MGAHKTDPTAGSRGDDAATRTLCRRRARSAEGGERASCTRCRARCPPTGDDAPLRALLRGAVLCVTPCVEAAPLAVMLHARGLDAAPVVDDEGVPLGVVTVSALAAAPTSDDSPVMTAGDVMTSAPAVAGDTPVAQAFAEVPEAAQYLLVTGDEGRVVGLLTVEELDFTRRGNRGHSPPDASIP